MKDSIQLNYDFRNSFIVCGVIYIFIYRGQKDVFCFYCIFRFVLVQVGQVCVVCDFVVIGVDVSGLFCFVFQIRQDGCILQLELFCFLGQSLNLLDAVFVREVGIKWEFSFVLCLIIIFIFVCVFFFCYIFFYIVLICYQLFWVLL